MSIVDLERMDVDELRYALVEETNDALELADELALAVETSRFDDARGIAANLRMVRGRMRALRSFIRVEEGRR